MDENQIYPDNKENKEQPPQGSESKLAIGVVCGLFTGLIGLIIGLCCFKEGSYERKTFMKGWLWTFVGVVIASVVIAIIMVIVVMNNPYMWEAIQNGISGVQ